MSQFIVVKVVCLFVSVLIKLWRKAMACRVLVFNVFLLHRH